MKETENKELILINSLQSCLKWESECLEKDFANFISEEIPEISKEQALTILNGFMKIPSLKRESINFDYQAFLENYLN